MRQMLLAGVRRELGGGYTKRGVACEPRFARQSVAPGEYLASVGIAT